MNKKPVLQHIPMLVLFSFLQGEGVQQLREALKILAERVLILEHMIGIHGEHCYGFLLQGTRGLFRLAG